MSLKPYPEYKDSGVDWFGSIPRHWQVLPGKRQLSARKEIVGSRHEQFSRLSLTMNGVLPRSKSSNDGLSPESFATYQLLRPGELVFKMIDLENYSTSRVGISYDEGLVSSAYIVARTNGDLQEKYAYWLYMSLYIQRIYNVLGSGVRSTLNADDVLNIPVLLPSVIEQLRIVAYLDRETAEIDAFIADQEELIELLSERRTATINRTVAAGLDSNASVIDSNIEWLGYVPQHWKIAKLSRLYPVQESGVSVNGYQEPAQAGEIGVLKTGASSKGYFDPNENKKVASHDLERVACPLRNGWLLINRANTPELVGSAALIANAPERLYLSDKLWQINFTEANNEFMYWWLSSASYKSQLQFHRVGASASMQNLSYADFKSLDAAIPPLDEQAEIAAYLNRETAEIDAAIADASEAIALSKERRAAVISAAVTGKIDVRDLVDPATNGVEGASVGAA